MACDFAVAVRCRHELISFTLPTCSAYLPITAYVINNRRWNRPDRTYRHFRNDWQVCKHCSIRNRCPVRAGNLPDEHQVIGSFRNKYYCVSIYTVSRKNTTQKDIFVITRADLDRFSNFMSLARF